MRLWLSSDGTFRPGDRPRAYVETAEDGYLVVLRADAEGRVRVLFPADPRDDNFVRGSRKLEIRWPNTAEPTYIGGRPAQGTVVAVWSPDPFKFDEFVRNDHWDYRVLGAKKLTDDPEAGLFDIAQRMAGDAQLKSDVATYSFGLRRGPGYGAGWAGWGGWGYPWHSGVRFSLFFGNPYYGFGYYRPFYYDPFCYDPFWGYDAFACSRYGYGFGSFYYRSPIYVRRPVYVGSPSAPRFTIPRDRVRVTPIEPRTRSRTVERSPRVRMPDRVSAGGAGSRGGRGGWSRPTPSSRGTSRGAAAQPRSRRH